MGDQIRPMGLWSFRAVPASHKPTEKPPSRGTEATLAATKMRHLSRVPMPGTTGSSTPWRVRWRVRWRCIRESRLRLYPRPLRWRRPLCRCGRICRTCSAGSLVAWPGVGIAAKAQLESSCRRALAGATLVVHAEQRSVSVEIELPDGSTAGQGLQQRILDRLEGRGFAARVRIE